MTGKLSKLVSDSAEKVDRSFGWARLPTIAAIPVLIGLRDRLRAKNLYDTGRGPLDKPPFEDPDVSRHLGARMINGTYNDLDDPLMGSLGSRFGRNVPLEHTYPDDPKRCSTRTRGSSAAGSSRASPSSPRRRSTCWPGPGSSSRCTTG